jgi:dihydroorotate dehydrogenase
MPDWSYRTVFRPLFFRLPAPAVRDLCLGVVGTLARLPLGPRVIDLLGHMRPPARLRRQLLGITFPTPVGLGAGIDVKGVALRALARFGFGFLEVGPVTTGPQPAAGAVARRPDQEAVWYPDPPGNSGLAAWAERLQRAGSLEVPVLVRVGYVPGAAPEQTTAACRQVVERLAPYADLFSLMTAKQSAAEGWDPGQWVEHLRVVLGVVREASPPRALLLSLPPDCDPAKADHLLGPAVELGAAGVLVAGGVQATPSGHLVGRPEREPALRLVAHLRRRWGDRLVLVGSGGVHEPGQALDMLRAGADLVAIDSGLVYAGPGLPKRVNDAILYAGLQSDPAPREATPPAAQLTWFWTTLLGISMLLGGLLALGIAATRVVLPYDEVLAGMSREQLAAVNPRLLAFMAHDRVTLAGTMVSVGALYLGLSLYGIRRGLHWARVAVLSSAFSGFGSFFLFLGFGYFDPFHAFVTAVLFQFLLHGLQARLSADPGPPPPNLHDDWRWRWSLWGQLLFVVQGSVLIVAGLVIATIGMTSVFVPEDLEFMQTTAEALAAANPRLVPLVAHDRASFGGMLIACGIAVLLPALWGYRQGARWLWWTLLASGTAGYAAAVGVHLAVGYTNLWHLAPAFAGAGLLAAGLVLSSPYLCRDAAAANEEWRRYKDPRSDHAEDSHPVRA